MPLDTIFQISSTVVLPGWLLLVFAPGWRGSQLLAGLVIPGLLAIAYVALVVSSFGEGGGGMPDFGSLAEIKALMASDIAILAGWIHYLAFDLFVGAWEARDAHRNRVPRWALLIALLFTFLSGPFGFLIYLVLRTATLKRFEGPAPG